MKITLLFAAFFALNINTITACAGEATIAGPRRAEVGSKGLTTVSATAAAATNALSFVGHYSALA